MAVFCLADSRYAFDVTVDGAFEDVATSDRDRHMYGSFLLVAQPLLRGTLLHRSPGHPQRLDQTGSGHPAVTVAPASEILLFRNYDPL